MKREETYKIPRRWFFFRKYPFAVLHDYNSNVVHDYLKAKEKLLEGKVIAHESVIGGFFFYRFQNGQLQRYHQYNQTWINEDMQKLDMTYEYERQKRSTPIYWLITNMSNDLRT
ncbi:hypothetical protein YDYSY3_38230 [Paenibacillus chitinolyticus]|uniref:hypothetical protein n=1 Tax=Paenibacillus chitinolyticus TaxID=79263 RepID=UPI0026E4F031|nr:hypothetical protein [Paenibacillus chitinolyticus]GKS12823.1 hypothetical protein YDYSY3_38230 [Paenibacillus chitinolyticus]